MSSSETEPPFDVERLLHYRTHPIDFFVDVLGVERDLVWSAMHEMTDSVLENRFTAVAGCHNSSKTFTAVCLSWWWALCWPDSLVYVTASKEEQIKGTFWEQLRERYDAAPVPLGGELLALDWKDQGRTRIAGRVARKDTGAGGATGMQGYKSQRLLMIFDEATAIDRAFWESAHGVVTFPENRWIAMANPTNPNCGFRDCFRPNSGWKAIHFDAMRNPNMVGAEIDREHQRVIGGSVSHPYLATPAWVESPGLRIWGEGSPAWESRVRGQFPSAAIDTLISLADFAMALERDPVKDGKTYVGADLAAQGDDYSVITVVRGNELVHTEWFHEPDTTKTADRIVQVARDFGIRSGGSKQVFLDIGGMGIGPYNHIRRFYPGWQVTGIDFGNNALNDLYADRRTEMWVNVRDWLRKDGSLKRARPDWIQMLEADLCGCMVDPLHIKGARTTIKLEKKPLMKKRLGHSPDHGDALALALSYRCKQGRLRREHVVRPVEPGGPRRNPPRPKVKTGFYEAGQGVDFYD